MPDLPNVMPLQILTPTEQLIADFSGLTRTMIAKMQRKNHDYAVGSDPFKNLRRHGTHGIVVRMDDKLARLDTLTQGHQAQVQDESIEDTAMDLATYALLLILLHREEKTCP